MTDQSANSWHLDSKLSFSVGQYSNAGIKTNNEDSIGIRIPEGMLLSTKGAVAIIADGVSAAEAGKEASETCVRNFVEDYFSTPDTWSVKKSTSQVLVALNRWLYSRGREFQDAKKGYVSTFSCVIFKSRTAHIFHVGDSRIYRLRAGKLEQLTRDHRTIISDEQSYLVRAVGLDVSLDVDCATAELEKGDIYLLTTDGIHDFVSEGDIIDLLQLSKAYDGVCKSLAQKALANKSNDNLSCQIICIDDLPENMIAEASQKLTALPFPPHLSVGNILDGYQIEKELYASSRSQIYLVTDIETGARYCMKTPSVNYEDDTAYIERFVLESWIGSRIHSPHVVKIISTNRPKHYLYYIMELIEGISLKQWIKENPNPSIQSVTYIAGQIAKGLRTFHRRETLHQDIRPANIMIDRNGEVKIIDFGACLVKGITEIASPIQREKIVGTAEYSAPEHVLAVACTEKSDNFSLAIVVFEMLTGRHPFRGELAKCRSEKAYLNTRYVPAYELNPLVPFWMDAALKKGLRYDPGRRHENIDALLNELTHPNPKYQQQYQAILSEDKPETKWKLIAGFLLLALIVETCVLWQQLV